MSAELADERVVAALRPHGRALIVPSVCFWVLAFLTMFLLGRVSWDGWDAAVWIGAAVLLLLFTLIPLLAWLTRRFVFTDRKIIVRSGIGGMRREIPYTRVNDLTLRRRGLQRLFGSGDILVSTGSDRVVVLGDVPRATLVQRMLVEQLERTRYSFEEGS